MICVTHCRSTTFGQARGRGIRVADLPSLCTAHFDLTSSAQRPIWRPRAYFPHLGHTSVCRERHLGTRSSPQTPVPRTSLRYALPPSEKMTSRGGPRPALFVIGDRKMASPQPANGAVHKIYRAASIVRVVQLSTDPPLLLTSYHHHRQPPPANINGQQVCAGETTPFACSHTFNSGSVKRKVADDSAGTPAKNPRYDLRKEAVPAVVNGAKSSAADKQYVVGCSCV